MYGAGDVLRNSVRNPGAGGFPFLDRSVELRPLLDDVVLKVMPDIRDQKVRFNYEISGGLPLVRGSAPDLRLGFTAILRSALGALPGGGFLSVSASYFAADGLPERVEVRVEERASGIPTEAPGEVVKPSFTAEPPSRDKDVDLAVARTALARAGGSIWVESEPGFGAAFIVALPVASNEG